MEIFLCVLAALIYFAEFYLHWLAYRVIAALVVAAPTGAIWILSALWPLLDIYLAVAIARGAYIAGKK